MQRLERPTREGDVRCQQLAQSKNSSADRSRAGDRGKHQLEISRSPVECFPSGAQHGGGLFLNDDQCKGPDKAPVLRGEQSQIKLLKSAPKLTIVL